MVKTLPPFGRQPQPSWPGPRTPPSGPAGGSRALAASSADRVLIQRGAVPTRNPLPALCLPAEEVGRRTAPPHHPRRSRQEFGLSRTAGIRWAQSYWRFCLGPQFDRAVSVPQRSCDVAWPGLLP